MATRHHVCAAEPGLEAKVAFLREPASYAEPACRVEALETHMSWVFLLDETVYKLKKPVWYEQLDFRSLAARHHFCAEEVRLNQRLAPGVYLGIVPLTIDRRRQLALSGGGAVVDWLVHMRRLPSENTLDYAMVHRSLASADLLRLAAQLARFYLDLPAEPVSAGQYRARFLRQTVAAWHDLSLQYYELPVAQVRSLHRAQSAALLRLGAGLDERVEQGRIVEGHGDLRPEHIYLGTPFVVIDCLEFSRELRIVDIADELGYLALECERLGSAQAGVSILHAYSALSGDEPPPELVHFYQSCRATTRARIAAHHLRDHRFRHSPHWIRKACDYLELAADHIGKCS